MNTDTPQFDRAVSTGIRLPDNAVARITRSGRRVGTNALAGLIVRYRVVLLVFIASGLGFVDRVVPDDMGLFAAGGHSIVSGHFGAVYARPFNQGGPVQLVLNWMLISSDGGPARLTVATVNVGLMMCAVGLCRRFTLHDVDDSPGQQAMLARRELVVGLLVLLWLSPGGVWDGHPVEVLVSVLWLFAVARVGVGRWVRAGVALGLAAAITPWGVLGFPVVLACRRLSVSFRAGAVAISVAVLLYLPFVLSGRFALLGQAWAISPGSLIHLLDPGLHQVSWSLRLVQAAVVVGGTTGAALLLRRHLIAAPVVALVAALLRVATDPIQYNYYWTSVGLVAIAIVATTRSTAGPHTKRAVWAAAAVAYLSWAGAASGWTLPAAGICLALTVLIAIGLSEHNRAAPRPVTPTPVTPTPVTPTPVTSTPPTTWGRR